VAGLAIPLRADTRTGTRVTGQAAAGAALRMTTTANLATVMARSPLPAFTP
jgi:hypothetical protein